MGTKALLSEEQELGMEGAGRSKEIRVAGSSQRFH